MAQLCRVLNFATHRNPVIQLLPCVVQNSTLPSLLKRWTLGYSLKTIPIPPKERYMKIQIKKTHSVFNQMRWRAHIASKN